MVRNHTMVKTKRINRPRLAAMVVVAAFAAGLTACAGGAPNQSWAGLAVKDDLVYMAHNYFIAAVHLDSGQLAWQYPAEADRTTLFYGDPLIDSQGDLVAGTYGGAVVKLDSANGSLKWKIDGDGQKIIAPISEGPDGKYYASSESGDLLIIDPSAGQVIKRIALGKLSSWGPMAVDGERIYIGTIEHKVLAVNFETGQIDWSADLGASIAGGVSLVDGKLVAGTFGNRIVALDPETGETLWEAQADDWVWQAPVVSDGALYATDLSGAVRAVALEDGAPLWSGILDAAVQAGPAVSGGKVFAGASKGTVRAYSAADGVQLWERKLEGGVYGRLRVSGDKLLAGVSGKTYQLAALNAETGVILWTFVEPT
jgi:outer membrane protein assembly factor BamB